MAVQEIPPYTIREYQPGDERAILETFNKVFTQVDPTFEPRTLEMWRWQFLANPSGWRIYLAVLDDGGRVISQYAGVGQRMLLEGEPANFSQALDSMTDPEFRRGLKKPGFFVLTGYPYAANYGGPPPDKDVIMWGLPVPAAWRIGKTYLKYELIRTHLKLVAPLEHVRLGEAGGVQVEEVERFDDAVDPLFAAAAEPWRAIAVRDAPQLNWRFVECPERSYQIALARNGSGELMGYAVYRTGAFDAVPDQGLVCDWLVRPGAEAAVHALRAWLVERARAEGAANLVAFFPDTAPEWLEFQRAGFRAERTRYYFIGRNYVKRYTMRWLYRNWYYTMGDTDQC